MATFVGTITMVPLVMVPEPFRMQVENNPSFPVVYLRVGSMFLPLAQMVAQTGDVVTVIGSDPVPASFGLPLVEVMSIMRGRPAPPPPPPPPRGLQWVRLH
ncbi:MAG TPA: hypothetical protein VD969_20880 [Symbiobacteriaceae bacterium]|nr:hypothetical protein [Symbiobacteriaceae bacterium]